MKRIVCVRSNGRSSDEMVSQEAFKTIARGQTNDLINSDPSREPVKHLRNVQSLACVRVCCGNDV